MADLREQLLELADAGRPLDVATAIVGTEQHLSGVTMADARRHQWVPEWADVYSEPISLPRVELGEQPCGSTMLQPVAAQICMAMFQIGLEPEGFQASNEADAINTSDEWVLDLLRRYVGVYCSADYTEGLPAVRIVARRGIPKTREAASQVGPVRYVDKRRVISGLQRDGMFGHFS